MLVTDLTLGPWAFLADAWPLILAAFAAGLVDSMGGGGGLITVPTLLNLGIPPAFLLGTNKTISAFGSVPALLRYRKARLLPHLPRPVWALLVAVCVICAAAGAWVSQNEAFLQRIGLIVPALLVLVMAFMIKRWFWDEPRQKRVARLSMQDKDEPEALEKKLGRPGMPLGISSIAFYDGLLGPGAGAFFLNLLEHNGVKTLTANATTKVFNLASNIGALLWFGSQGKSLWSLGILGAGCYALGNYLGAGLVIKRGQGLVRGVVLVVVSGLLLRYLYRYVLGPA